ncbi:MAG: hypothetical protein HZB51_30075 [Chloroflexi bacterium]|nr:hypothetical protein [Chloroflexota bacterium]
MKLKTGYMIIALMLVALSVGACSLFPQPTPTTFVLPLPSPIVTLTQAPVTPTATLPVSSPSVPTLPPQSASTVTPPPQAQPTTTAKRISFAPGAMSATVQGTVAANSADMHVLRALAGQVMSVTFSPAAENVTIQISGADGSVLASGGAKFTTGVFNLTQTQDYFFSIISSRNTPTNYSLQITIPPLQSPVVTVPTPSPKRITFAPGGTSASVQGVLPKNGMDRWVIRAQAGQTMTAKAIPQNGNVMLIVFGVDGDVYQTDHVGSPDFSQRMRTTQDYYIDVRAWGDTAPSYTLQVTIPPLSQATSPAPQRITFARGAISALVSGSTATPGQDRFVIRAQAGQTMVVNAASAQNNVILIIYGTDGNVLISDHAGATSWTGGVPTTQDYIIDTRSVASNVVPFTLQVTIRAR